MRKSIPLLLIVLLGTIAVLGEAYGQMSQQQALKYVDQWRSVRLIHSVKVEGEMVIVDVGRYYYRFTAKQKRGFGMVLSLAHPKKFITVFDAYTEQVVLNVLPGGDTTIRK